MLKLEIYQTLFKTFFTNKTIIYNIVNKNQNL